MRQPTTLDRLFGNLLLTNILLVERNLEQQHNAKWQRHCDAMKTERAWGRVLAFGRPAHLAALPESTWKKFLTDAVGKHTARAGHGGPPSCFLLYVEPGRGGSGDFLRTAVPESGLAGLLGYPYEDEDVINGITVNGLQITPPLGLMVLPWQTFQDSAVAQATDQSIVYHPSLFDYPRGYREFDILVGSMSVLIVRVPHETRKPLLGFLVLGSVHENAFGRPVASGNKQPTVGEEDQFFLKRLVDNLAVASNLAEIRKLSASAIDEERRKLGAAAARLKHDASIWKSRLDEAADRLDFVSESLQEHKKLVRWAGQRIRVNGRLMLNGARLFLQETLSDGASVSIEEFADLVNMLLADIKGLAPDRFTVSQNIESRCTRLPALLQAAAVQLIVNAERHRDATSETFDLAVGLDSIGRGVRLTIESWPHTASKIADLKEAWATPLEVPIVRGIPLVLRAARDQRWQPSLDCGNSKVRISILCELSEAGDGVH